MRLISSYFLHHEKNLWSCYICVFLCQRLPKVKLLCKYFYVSFSKVCHCSFDHKKHIIILVNTACISGWCWDCVPESKCKLKKRKKKIFGRISILFFYVICMACLLPNLLAKFVSDLPIQTDSRLKRESSSILSDAEIGPQAPVLHYEPS